MTIQVSVKCEPLLLLHSENQKSEKMNVIPFPCFEIPPWVSFFADGEKQVFQGTIHVTQFR